MFRKLKEKITEEVKISPLGFPQLAQATSDKFQNTVTDENFFSLTEDDNALLSPPPKENEGFSSVSLFSPSQENREQRYRRSSTSSFASDVSFLPRYDSVSNMYHLQVKLNFIIFPYQYR